MGTFCAESAAKNTLHIGRICGIILSTAVERKAHHAGRPPGPNYNIWEGNRVPNGIYIQTEYHGKLIRKIVCNGDERWFIGSNCAVTFLSMDDCMAAIDRL